MNYIYNFSILGETPAKKNSRINLKNGISIPSERYREWHSDAEMQLRGLRGSLPESPIETQCEITLNFIHGDKRRRDSDNGTSSIMDLLVDCGILSDDNWNIVRTIHVLNNYQKNEPKCDVLIRLY